MNHPTPRMTLRHLPLPAKLVLTVFLCSVGLGYFSAMVQLHQKHSKKEGEPLPTPDDVVEVFAGLKKIDPNAPAPCACLDRLLTADRKATDVSKDNMAPAFFAKSKGWQNIKAGRTDAAALEAERNGELESMLAWVRAEKGKKEAYENDSFLLPTELKGKPVTKEFMPVDGNVKIRSLIEARCVNCHKDQAPSLSTFADLEPLITAPSQEIIKGKYVRSSRQVSVEKLTQSTHAHLLSFSVLFAFTGLIFAYTTYWTGLRCILGPIVLIAQIADISCWWLARLPDMGPLFAMSIMATGAVVGLGLSAQILLSLVNMYGKNGTAVVILLVLLGGAGVGYVGLKVIQPALEDEKLELQKAKDREKDKDKKPDVAKKADPEVAFLEHLIMGPIEANEMVKFNGKGTMAPAFFTKEPDFKKVMAGKAPDDVKAKLMAEREGERKAVQAWIRLPNAEREKAFESDNLPLPKDLEGKPLTPEFIEGKKVKIKNIIEIRCMNCHAKGAEQEDYPLEKYTQLLMYMEPPKK